MRTDEGEAISCITVGIMDVDFVTLLRMSIEHQGIIAGEVVVKKLNHLHVSAYGV